MWMWLDWADKNLNLKWETPVNGIEVIQGIKIIWTDDSVSISLKTTSVIVSILFHTAQILPFRTSYWKTYGMNLNHVILKFTHICVLLF